MQYHSSVFLKFYLFNLLTSNTDKFTSVSFLPTFFLLQCQKNENTSEEHREEVQVLKEQLREQEETVQDLKKQLAVAKVNLKDAEIKYATQVQNFFSIRQSVSPTSLLRLV